MAPFAIYLYGPQLGPQLGPLPTGFEQAAERLAATERLHFEPDGSFVWSGIEGKSRWQLDGMVYDFAGRVQYLDLKGACPRWAWHRLLETFAGSPAAQVTVLRLPEQRRVSVAQFEKEIWGKPSQPGALA